nr:uncharacterized protein LOC111517824 [Leptinotarsa decemlineata]
MCPKSGKVLAPKGYKNVYEIRRGSEKEAITVLLVFSEDGKTVSPMVVFPFVRPNKAIVDSVPSEWFIGRSESGWMKSDTFFDNKWVIDNHVKKPILLLVDGHKSHLSLELSTFCSDNQIILYALPPNTTHILQPADVSVFKPLKSNWKKQYGHGNPQNLNCVLTKSTFCPMLRDVLNDKSLPQAIKNGFRKCGLFPFDPEAVDFSKCVQNHLENLSDTADQEFVVTEDKFNITENVLSSMTHKLFEKGVENIINDIEQLKLIKEEYSKTSQEKTTTKTNNLIALTSATPPHDFMIFDFEEFMANDFFNEKAPNENEVAPKIVILENITVLPSNSESKNLL